MSVWQEEEHQPSPTTQASMCDLVFKIDCQTLPVDHAEALSNALCTAAPLLTELSGTGIQPIYVAGSQNGWQRPDAANGEQLILSKRTKLRIRASIDRAQELIDALSDTTLKLGEHQLSVISGHQSPLQTSTTLFSRHTVYGTNTDSEESFLRQVIADCEAAGYSPKKLLCGKHCSVSIQSETIQTRSLLIADVTPEYSIALQENGLGDHRLIGCGILIPYKNTGAI